VVTNSEREPRRQGPSGATTEQAAFAGILAEYLFILLPLIVLALVRFFRGSFANVWSTPEWSFAASVLFGQTIVKFVSGVTNLDYRVSWQVVGLSVTIMIVLGLVPALVVLSFALVAEQQTLSLAVAQLVLFGVATFLFLSIGRFGQVLVGR
jgi:hypothetical protein